MPRRSPYTIVLRQEERYALEARAAKYTLPYFEVVRARMILHAAEGLSNDQIAERLDTRREVVSLWRKRFFEERLAGLEELPDRVGPGLFPPELVVQVKALACELPCQQQSAAVALEFAEESPGSRRQCGLVAQLSRNDPVALAARRCHSSLATSLLDFPPRPGRLRPRLAGFWISTSVSGKASRCKTMNLCSRLTRKPACKLGVESIPPCHPSPVDP